MKSVSLQQNIKFIFSNHARILRNLYRRLLNGTQGRKKMTGRPNIPEKLNFVWGASLEQLGHDPGTQVILESMSAVHFYRTCQTKTWRGYCRIVGRPLSFFMDEWAEEMDTLASDLEVASITYDTPYEHRMYVGAWGFADLVPDPRCSAAFHLEGLEKIRDHRGDGWDFSYGPPRSDFVEVTSCDIKGMLSLTEVLKSSRPPMCTCRHSDILVKRWLCVD
jgi:hypothetical protein